ncbi:MAG: alpha/beta hydrolase [Victivallales bacterium]|nr:alpha/beta hydrolase [Victivallales bacterium]
MGGCFSEKIIFQPQRSGMTPDADMTMLEVAPGVNITLMYLRAPGSVYTLLYSHGNAEDLFDLKPMLQEYQSRGYSIICYDYEGYGASNGNPSEAACYRDIDAIYQYMIGTLSIAPETIIIYGRSVGGGPSCYLAEKSVAAGLVLESTFTSAFRVLSPIPLPFDKFMNLKRLKNINIPLLIYHGKMDKIIPFKHGKRLYEAAREPKTFVPVDGAGHNDLMLQAGELYWNALRKFTEGLSKGK